MYRSWRSVLQMLQYRHFHDSNIQHTNVSGPSCWLKIHILFTGRRPQIVGRVSPLIWRPFVANSDARILCVWVALHSPCARYLYGDLHDKLLLPQIYIHTFVYKQFKEYRPPMHYLPPYFIPLLPGCVMPCRAIYDRVTVTCVGYFVYH